MVAANELRVGSIVKYDGEIEVISFEGKVYKKNLIFKVANIQTSTEKDSSVFINGIIKPHELKGVKLTERFVKKAGFVVFKSLENGYKQYRNKCVRLWVGKGSVQMDINSDSIALNFLHELQNLYHALTGEELNISL